MKTNPAVSQSASGNGARRWIIAAIAALAALLVWHVHPLHAQAQAAAQGQAPS